MRASLSNSALAHARAARRNCLRCELTRKDAIFLQVVTFDGLSRRAFTTNGNLCLHLSSDVFGNQSLSHRFAEPGNRLAGTKSLLRLNYEFVGIASFKELLNLYWGLATR